MKYPIPLRGVPAGMELFTLFGFSAGGVWGAGVKGVEKGCAADVEVAAGEPSWLPDGGPRGELTSWTLAGGVVERRRLEGSREVRIRRRQRWQIIFARY